MPNTQPTEFAAKQSTDFMSRLSKQDRLVFERLPICDKQYFAELLLETVLKSKPEKSLTNQPNEVAPSSEE